MTPAELKQQVNAVYGNATALLVGVWDVERAMQVFEQSEVAADSAQHAGCDDLSEALLGLSAYLSSFVDSSMLPRPHQLQQMRALADAVGEAIQRLQAAVAVADLVPEPVCMVSDGPAVLYFGRDVQRIQQLTQRFASVQLSVHAAPDPAALVREMRKEESRALILEAETLAEWLRVAGAQSDPLPNLPCVVVSGQDQLSSRLQAIRAGAETFFVLPADLDAVVPRLSEQIADRERPYQVLIIDDDTSMTMFCDSVLRHNGMRTRTINEPAAALGALEDFQPDVILVDLYMPEINGMEMLALFRAHPRTLVTPVILLSGDEDAERRFDTLLTGGDDYLTKPIRPRHLVAAVTSRAKRARWLRRELGGKRG